MQNAVLVIDVQQGLCEGPNAAYDSDGVISRINTVTRKAREANQLVILIQHEADDELVYGSADWQLADGLETGPKDLVLRKTSPDAFNKTDLLEVLQAREIGRLIVCGMHTEYCVDTTTRRALALGFPVSLVSDGHTSAGNPILTAQQVISHHNVTLCGISSFGPRATTVSAAAIDPLD